MKKVFQNIGVRVSTITLIINSLLFVFKFVAGLIAHSQAMISDAIHSLTDSITTIIVIFGLVMSSKKADKEHPYGHERIESVFAIILSFILLVTGLSIGYMGIKAVFFSSKLTAPGYLALWAAVISIIVKEIMFYYTMRTAKKIASSSMEADAWHHRSDALSSIGSFIGILGSRLGLPILDPLCSVFICILIAKASIEIFMQATEEMLDTACDDETNKEIVDVILGMHEDIKIYNLKTRMFGSKIYIDADIAFDGNMTLNDANEIAQKIHHKIEKKFKLVKHCNIHIMPKINTNEKNISKK